MGLAGNQVLIGLSYGGMNSQGHSAIDGAFKTCSGSPPFQVTDMLGRDPGTPYLQTGRFGASHLEACAKSGFSGNSHDPESEQ